ncbi:MAG: phage tail assembly chaperone [Burkholderiaceae bacterium]|jgi:hypothetical protein|nr:phage tail assembly chaperone [Burkholderiaceae bacterium]
MLKLAPEPTFTVSVVVPVPGGADELINVTFRHMGKSALKAWIEQAKGREDIDSLMDVVVGWAGVEAEFSRDALAQVLDNYTQAAVAMLEAYVGELGRAAAKN